MNVCFTQKRDRYRNINSSMIHWTVYLNLFGRYIHSCSSGTECTFSWVTNAEVISVRYLNPIIFY